MAVSAISMSVGAADEPPPPLRLGSHPRIDAADFRVTTFAWGLPYTSAMQELADGSLLVAVNEAPAGGYVDAVGRLLRLIDEDADGVAERIEPVGIVDRIAENGPLVYKDLPSAVVQMRTIRDLLFVSSRDRQRSSITVLRAPGHVDQPYEVIGSLDLEFPLAHIHGTYAMALRNDQETGAIELFFNVGSRLNSESDDRPIRLSGLVEAVLRPESLYLIKLIDDGSVVSATEPRLVATGLRNAAGLAFHPTDGDLYLTDNGIDGLDDPDEPLSADEINVIEAGSLGQISIDFGFPNSYVEYRSGARVGVGAEPPLVAIQPIGNSEAEGAAEMTFAPSGFPEGLAEGLFVGFHGRWGLAGLDNEENPLLYVEPQTGLYFEFIPNDLATVGHLDNVLATNDSLFIADLDSDGELSTADAAGVIYQVKAIAD